MQLSVKGVEDALKEISLSYDEAVDANVRVDLNVEQTAFSLVFPTGAELVVPAPASSEGLTGKLKEWFSGASVKEKEENSTTTETATPPQPQEKRIKLTLSSLPASLHPMTGDTKGSSMEKLFALNYAETMKSLREESYNALESKLYLLKDVMENEEGKFGAFHNATQAHELEALKNAHSASLTWLEEDGWSATLEQIQEEAAKIVALEQPIKDRLKSVQVKAGALSDLQKALFAGRTFLQQARKNLTTTDESRYTFKEIDEFEAHLFKTENWLRPLMRKDEQAKPWEEGAYTATELEGAGRGVQEYFIELTNRKPAKKTSTESATEKATESSQSSQSSSTPATESSQSASDSSQSTQSTSSESKSTETSEPAHHTHDEL